MEIKTLTYDEQEAVRKERLNEPGTQAPCPFCQRPRVQRRDYIRCNPCGVNWLDEEMHLPNYLNRNPSVARKAVVPTVDTAKPPAEPTGTDAE